MFLIFIAIIFVANIISQTLNSKNKQDKQYQDVLLCIFLALIVAGVWGIYKYEQAQHLKQYWSKINSPEKYNGDGFTAVFLESQLIPIYQIAT
jgi:hypothetical protein